MVKPIVYDIKNNNAGIFDSIVFKDGEFYVLANFQGGLNYVKESEVNIIEPIFIDHPKVRSVYNGDIFKDNEENPVFSIEFSELDDKKLKLVEYLNNGGKDVTDISKDTAIEIISGSKLLGNIYLEDNPESYLKEINSVYTPNFKVKVVKHGKDIMYACNNVLDEVIDLISVSFIGFDMVDEQYVRITYDYNEYQQLVEKDFIKDLTDAEAFGELEKILYGDTSKGCDCEEDFYADADADADDGNGNGVKGFDSFAGTFKTDEEGMSTFDFSNMSIDANKITITSDNIITVGNNKPKKCEKCLREYKDCMCDLWD